MPKHFAFAIPPRQGSCYVSIRCDRHSNAISQQRYSSVVQQRLPFHFEHWKSEKYETTIENNIEIHFHRRFRHIRSVMHVGLAWLMSWQTSRPLYASFSAIRDEKVIKWKYLFHNSSSVSLAAAAAMRCDNIWMQFWHVNASASQTKQSTCKYIVI